MCFIVYRFSGRCRSGWAVTEWDLEGSSSPVSDAGMIFMRVCFSRKVRKDPRGAELSRYSGMRADFTDYFIGSVYFLQSCCEKRMIGFNSDCRSEPKGKSKFCRAMCSVKRGCFFALQGCAKDKSGRSTHMRGECRASKKSDMPFCVLRSWRGSVRIDKFCKIESRLCADEFGLRNERKQLALEWKRCCSPLCSGRKMARMNGAQ